MCSLVYFGFCLDCSRFVFDFCFIYRFVYILSVFRFYLYFGSVFEESTTAMDGFINRSVSFSSISTKVFPKFSGDHVKSSSTLVEISPVLAVSCITSPLEYILLFRNLHIGFRTSLWFDGICIHVDGTVVNRAEPENKGL